MTTRMSCPTEIGHPGPREGKTGSPPKTYGDDKMHSQLHLSKYSRTKIPLLNIIVFGFTRAKI
jgi:hypothetical protein